MNSLSICTSNWSQKEGNTHPPPERSKAVQIQQIKQVTKLPWSSRSMTVPSDTLLIQYFRLQNKLPVKHCLPPLQGQPTVRHKLQWALRHVTHRDQNLFTTQQFSHRPEKILHHEYQMMMLVFPQSSGGHEIWIAEQTTLVSVSW